MKTIKFLLIPIVLIFVMACVSKEDISNIPQGDHPKDIVEEGPLAALNVSATFNYKTSQQVNVKFNVPDFLNQAVFTLYSLQPEKDSIAFSKATFDNAGAFEQEYTLSATTDSILAISNYLGLTNDIRIPIIDGKAEFDYNSLYDDSDEESGKNTHSISKSRAPQQFSSSALAVEYTYLSGYDKNGVPDNYEKDKIDKELLNDINASLPEYKRVPDEHPEYLEDVETEIILTKEADVWVTFVAEGADWRNALGFYTYQLGDEPTTEDEIDEHIIIFPHLSMKGSGGKMKPGYKVHLVCFPANTVVSWFLVANGWYGWYVGGTTRHYAKPNVGVGPVSDLPKQMVSIYDDSRDLTIFAFEDYPRYWWADEDFNDVVFYATTNPVDAVETSNMVTINKSDDADDDGVDDELDEFPEDATKAFNNYYPGEDTEGKLVYEDLWPSQGDYDFNDLVVGYNYNVITNGNNDVTYIDVNFTIEDIGGSLHNGFAFVLPIAPSEIESIENQILNTDYISVDSNGTETGTDNDESVIFVVGDAFGAIGETINIKVKLKSPITQKELGEVPFNPFLVVNGDRAREVHLSDFPPTSKADYLGTFDDNSNAENGFYYKTDKNLPWGLNIFYGFTPPTETVPITEEYPRFSKWANSDGAQDLDWYKK